MTLSTIHFVSSVANFWISVKRMTVYRIFHVHLYIHIFVQCAEAETEFKFFYLLCKTIDFFSEGT